LFPLGLGVFGALALQCNPFQYDLLRRCRCGFLGSLHHLKIHL
jgi:hypothetical protein